MPNFILNINTPDDDLMLSSSDIECYLLNSEMDVKLLKELAIKLQNSQKIVLLSGKSAVDLCISLKADGVVADLSKSNNIKQDIKAIRKVIGSKFLGIVCRNRRHEAMLVSENEPDFIIFKIWQDGMAQTLDLANWYEEFFLLQMAVFPQDNEVDFEQYPSDLLILTPTQYKIFVAKK